ncbi:restriction endonuclease subunit S [Pantoea agglomerans]
MAMYKAYPEYKDSGIEWLGDIPEGWTVSKVKYLAPFQVGWTPPTKNDANFIGDNLWVNISDLKDKFISSTAKFISDKAAKEASMDITPKGSLLYSFKLSVGAVSFAGCDLYTNEAIASFLSHAQLPLSYLYYALPIFIIENASTNIYGAKILNQELIKNSFLLAPPHGEAEKVANFLDHETAKIDNLIAKQQQLIELLKEKRQAVISHAVTKGLDPNVPMKDSGVEWLGEVPAHWAIKRLKHISPKVGVGLVINPSTYTKDEGVYFIFGGDVKEFGFDLTKTRRISPQDSNKLLPSRLNSRDLVSVRVGYPGITSVVTDDLEGSNCASIIIIRRGSYNSDWLCAAMNVWVGRQQVDLASYGAAQKQFNVSDAIEFVFPVPPINEQNDIADFVQKTLNKFDDLTQKALKQIELLQERRTALISAAVTGKIDVRDWVAPDTQDVEEPQEATA